MRVDLIAKVRVLVGFLGEKAQFDWWGSSFFHSASDAFLAPVFPKTAFLAKCEGVTEAARLIHDERIGIGSIYHLFRLPEDLERSIHDYFSSPDSKEIGSLLADQKSGIRAISEYGEPLKTDQGPVMTGKVTGLEGNRKTIENMARRYLFAFNDGVKVFPYFSHE